MSERLSHLIDERKRLTRVPHTILVQLLGLLENPSQMTVVKDEPTYRVMSCVLEYTESLSVRAFRSMSIANERVLVDTWDLEWIKNPNIPPV